VSPCRSRVPPIGASVTISAALVHSLPAPVKLNGPRHASWPGLKRTRTLILSTHANNAPARAPASRRSEERRTRHVPTAGSAKRSRLHQHKARSGRVPRLGREQIGSEPIRSVTAPRTGSRGRSLNASGMLRTRVSHPVRTLPIALSGSARDAPGRAAPSEPDATPCTRPFAGRASAL
jgi:hypothetical protein